MPFTVVYDANVLVGNTQRDLLVRIAQTPLVQAKWTDRILDEMVAAVQKSRPNIPPEKLRPETIDDVLGQLERSGIVRSAAELRRPPSMPQVRKPLH
jgi:hypothetical protein